MSRWFVAGVRGWQVGFEERLNGRRRDRLLFQAPHAGEAAGVGGGVVAARLPRNGFRHRSHSSSVVLLDVVWRLPWRAAQLQHLVPQ